VSNEGKFRVGDVVRSLEGGPKMVVCSVDEGSCGKGRVRCRWFDGTLHVQRDDLNTSTLEHVSPPHPYRGDVASMR
jgi:uncharacterized protein YodC (DUF2158 family)